MMTVPAYSRVQGPLQAVALAVMSASTLGVFSGQSQFCDLCSHFRGQYAALLPVLAILLWRKKLPRWSAAALMACLHNLLVIGPYYWTAVDGPEADQTTLSIVSFNVHTSNRRSADVLAWLQERNPDVILLIEVDHRWMRELAPLRETWPHHVIAPQDHNFGIALFSRFPLTECHVAALGPEQPESIRAELDVNGQRINFLGTHPLPPMLPRMWDLRNEQLASVARTVRAAGLPTIVAGDLNATPWCSSFQALLRDGQLADTAQGFGMQRTWHAALPCSWIPIDHILTTREFVARRRAVGPSCGSDHHAIEAVLGLRPPSAPAGAVP